MTFWIATTIKSFERLNSQKPVKSMFSGEQFFPERHYSVTLQFIEPII
jgi:hypothetical protein